MVSLVFPYSMLYAKLMQSTCIRVQRGRVRAPIQILSVMADVYSLDTACSSSGFTRKTPSWLHTATRVPAGVYIY